MLRNKSENEEDGKLFNYSDFSYNNIKNYGTRSFYVGLATKFLSEYSEKRSYRTKKTKKPVEKERTVYIYQYNSECVLKLVQAKNKIATINYQHLLNYIDKYYEHVTDLAAKQGYDQSTSMIDLNKLTREETETFETYFGLKRFLKFLEGNKPYYFCEVMKEAVVNVIRAHFTDLKLPTFNKIEIIKQKFSEDGKEDQEEDQEDDIEEDQDERDLSSFENRSEFDDLHISIKNYESDLDIFAINSDHVSTLGTVKGQLTSYDNTNRIDVRSSAWRCQSTQCNHICIVAGSKPPTKCFNCKEKFGFVEEDSLNETVDFVFIKLQQKYESDRTQIGLTDITVKIQGKNLINYFRENMKPAGMINVTGVFELASSDINGSSRSSNSNEKIIIINAVSIEFEDVNKSLEFNDRYFEITKRVHPDFIENHRTKLLSSTVPHVYGQDAIKQGILLMCVGAEAVKRPDGSRVKGDLVLMIAGDSSMAKSENAIWVMHVLPRSIRTVGGGSSGTSKVGLTAIVETINGVKRVSFGVLSLCDRSGVAIIDELDKRTKEDFEILAGPLDDNQKIEIHKGGFHYSANARCPVLLIGNASSTDKKSRGKWDPKKSIFEQTNFASWLTARSDLIFVVYDLGDPEFHRQMLEHIKKFNAMSVHESEYEVNQKNKVYSDSMFDKLEQNIVNNDFDGIYDIEFMRHEIQFLKQSYRPKLIPNSDAYNLLEKEWLKLKQMIIPEDIGEGKVIGNGVMDARKLNSLFRLACAEARLRRHHVVTIEDAESAIHVMLASIASMLPISQDPGAERLDANVNPIDIMNKFLSENKNKDKIRKAMVETFINFRDTIKKTYMVKFKKFNRAIMSIGIERCEGCRGKGELVHTSPNGIDYEYITCPTCGGDKMKYNKPFTYYDLEHVVVNCNPPIFSSKECKLYYNTYLDSGILDWNTSSTVKIQYDLGDSVVADTVIEKLSTEIADDRTNIEMQKEFGVIINLDYSSETTNKK